MARPAPQPPSVLPDAEIDNWVDRAAPPRLRPWLKLGRLDRPAGAWLLLLPGWQGIALADAAAAGRLPDLSLYLRIAVGALVMRAAGCAYNDIVDRDIDRKVARTAGRPLASGQVSVRGAWVFVNLCCLCGLAVLASLNLASIILGVLSLALVAAYPFMKRITWWPQAWLGLTFNWGALLGFSAAGAGASGLMIVYGEAMRLSGRWLTFAFAAGPPPSLAAALLYASGVFWTLGYDTIYAVQDIEDDALAGVKSSARRLGARARQGVFSFYLICIALTLACGAAAGLGPAFYLLAIVYGLHLVNQARRVAPEDPSGALILFRSNRGAGLLLVAALALGRLNFSSLPGHLSFS